MDMKLYDSPHRIERRNDKEHGPKVIYKKHTTIEDRYYSMSLGNLKISGNTLIWNLSAIKTCPNAGICKKYCYAVGPERLYKNVKNARSRNHELSQKKTFIPDMIKIIDNVKNSKHKIKSIRLHESGDFYNEKYLKAWIEIAEHHKDIRFYTYTKSIFVQNYDIPDNMVIWFSHGGTEDSKYTKDNNQAVVIMNGDTPPKGSYVCPAIKDNKYVCGKNCSYCRNQKHNSGKVVAFYLH